MCTHLVLALDLRASFVVRRITRPVKEENPVIEAASYETAHFVHTDSDCSRIEGNYDMVKVPATQHYPDTVFYKYYLYLLPSVTL